MNENTVNERLSIKEAFLKIKDFVKEKYNVASSTSEFFNTDKKNNKLFFPKDEIVTICCEYCWCENDSSGSVGLVITNELIVYYDINPDCFSDTRCSGCKEWTNTKLVQIQKELYNTFYPDNKIPLCKECRRKGLGKSLDEIIELIDSIEYIEAAFEC